MRKTCQNCKAVKALSDFNKRAARPDGRTTTCKACIAVKRKTYVPGGRVDNELSAEKRRIVYQTAIVNMRRMGLVSEHTTNEMLGRVGNL